MTIKEIKDYLRKSIKEIESFINEDEKWLHENGYSEVANFSLRDLYRKIDVFYKILREIEENKYDDSLDVSLYTKYYKINIIYQILEEIEEIEESNEN